MKFLNIATMLLLLLVAPNSFAQVNKNIAGTWEGKLNLGVELRIIFHFKDEGNGHFTGKADSPDQGGYGLPCDSVIVNGDSIRIFMSNAGASFAGKLDTDSSIRGTFAQRVMIPLLLKKTNGGAFQPKRPQSPQAPFPYRSEEVEYDNADRSLHYGATITIPHGKGPFPAAVLITGSGPQDRDETIMNHKLFAVIADALTRNGFVVLRVDDRGTGKSTGIFANATSADFADDVNTSFNYLLTRPEVNKKKAGLIGHSEGGMIASIVAAKRNDIDFTVLLAGPGIKINELMSEQNAAILHSVGISKAAIDAYIPFYKNLMTIAATTPDSASGKNAVSTMLKNWMASTDTLLIKELGFEDEQTSLQIIQRLVREFSGKWFRYFLTFDPQPYLQKINSKVLALNGARDIQVIDASNLAGIEVSLKKGRTKQYTIKSLPGLNHLFQTCTKCTLAEYGVLEETFSPIALKEINDWLNKYVK
jgi:pimeloyl-ACP methyl ester carboxylesterase